MHDKYRKELTPLVDLIKRGKKVTFFVGAGALTSVGIPDFRSPKTGLYANLEKLNLPYSEAVFDIDYFREKPKAFYTLATQLYPGTFFPSKFHYFMRLIQDKKQLMRIYTQNIDTLERIAGVEGKHIVEAHGSFATNHCIDCGKEMSTEELKKQMFDDENDGIPTCSCKGYVKPDIVFFGEGLPERFFDCWEEDCDDVEVAIVAGTSLTVHPFASLPAELNKKSLRILANKELVGDFKDRKRKTDIVSLHTCDEFAETVCDLLGWKKELEALMKKERELFERKLSTKEGKPNSNEEEEIGEGKSTDETVDIIDKVKGLKI